MRIDPELKSEIGIVVAILGAVVAAGGVLWTRIQQPELTETQLFLETLSIILIGVALVGLGYAMVKLGKRGK